MAQRVTTYLYRGLQFLAIGFSASVIGHGLTKYMVSRAIQGMTSAASELPSQAPAQPALCDTIR